MIGGVRLSQLFFPNKNPLFNTGIRNTVFYPANCRNVLPRILIRLKRTSSAYHIKEKETVYMCGIVGFVGNRDAAPILLDGLKRLEYRGYDSAGVAVLGDTGINMIKTRGMVSALCDKSQNGAALPGDSGIGHTRWATHGIPTDTNAHPHMSDDGKFAIVHNGIIENFAELRDELIAQSYSFRSDTDTEVIVHLLAMYYNGNLKEAALRTAARLNGSYALGILCSDEPGKLFAVREASPLILGVGVGENYFASDVTALISHTRNIIYLEDGESAELSPDGIVIYNSAGAEITKPISRVTWDVEVAEKGGFEHFMLKEIMEQPRALQSTIEPRIKDGRIVLDDFDLTKDDWKDIKKIVITGCGSAYYAGCVGRYVIEALCRVPVDVDIASELRYRDPIIDEHTLLIAISQSGETADTIAAIKECKARGAKVLTIVNVVGSTIANLADYILYTWANPEIAVATTKGYTTQVAVLELFAVALAENLGRLSEDHYSRLVNALSRIPSDVQRAIDMNPHIPYLAKRYCKNNPMFFIGRHIDHAVSMEGSLKLKEISYIHSEAFAAGEMKHGPIALIEPGRLVVALACYEPMFDKLMNNIEACKAREARVLAVAPEGDRRMLTVADDVLFVPRTEDMFFSTAEIVPLQLFAYHVAKENGCDIDKPKNLAKSVTVE